ncbi:MipA/OmpV family protein [Lacimicrobium sp. SS2-24]|uniref:MipA/OmpV family protein n=1 Tax=Lacimicrobium sp. SS2-24 TaxID=2005569 RepID=UPI000B4BC347|nr:MipA/OmpV family protein [Lacimicrobium sp. SS2-24]
MLRLFVVLLGISNSLTWADELKLGIGAFGMSLPSYPGSDERHNYFVPLPFVYYQSDQLSIDREGINRHLWEKGRWQFDISANAGLPVESEKNSARQGMADLDWRFELGPALKYYFRGQPSVDERTFAELYVRKAITTDFSHIDDAGWFAGFSFTHQQPLFESTNEKWLWTIELDVRMASDKAHQYYYGVTEQEALPERSAFEASGGYWGSQLSSGVVYKQGNWWMAGFARYQGLTGSQSESSPLLKQSHQWLIGLGVVWIFYDKEI